jgi:transposase InsO family protein
MNENVLYQSLTRRRRRAFPLDAPETLNAVWSLDFVHDALYDGRRFRTLNVLDDGNREGLGIDVATAIPSRRAIRFMAYRKFKIRPFEASLVTRFALS